MSASLKFKFIEKSLLDILSLIVSNQNLLRYIKYLDNDPLNPSHPNIDDSLINTNIFISPFDESIADGLEVKVFFYPAKSNLRSNVLGKHTFLFDIVCPIQYFLLPGMGMIRPIRIADELAQVIDQKLITGIGETTILEANLFRLSNDSDYIIYSLPIEVNSTAIKGK